MKKKKKREREKKQNKKRSIFVILFLGKSKFLKQQKVNGQVVPEVRCARHIFTRVKELTFFFFFFFFFPFSLRSEHLRSIYRLATNLPLIDIRARKRTRNDSENRNAVERNAPVSM